MLILSVLTSSFIRLTWFYRVLPLVGKFRSVFLARFIELNRISPFFTSYFFSSTTFWRMTERTRCTGLAHCRANERKGEKKRARKKKNNERPRSRNGQPSLKETRGKKKKKKQKMARRRKMRGRKKKSRQRDQKSREDQKGSKTEKARQEGDEHPNQLIKKTTTIKKTWMDVWRMTDGTNRTGPYIFVHRMASGGRMEGHGGEDEDGGNAMSRATGTRNDGGFLSLSLPVSSRNWLGVWKSGPVTDSCFCLLFIRLFLARYDYPCWDQFDNFSSMTFPPFWLTWILSLLEFVGVLVIDPFSQLLTIVNSQNFQTNVISCLLFISLFLRGMITRFGPILQHFCFPSR